MWCSTIENKVDLNTEFRNTLLYIWQEVRKLVESSKFANKQDKDFIPLKLKKLADLFYEKFKDTPIGVQKTNYLYNKFNSVVIYFKDKSAITIPDYFYQQALVWDTLDFSDIIAKEDSSWIDVFSDIFELAYGRVIPLRHLI